MTSTYSFLLLTGLLLFIPVPVWPHGGGLDTYGCHQDRKQKEYHCHQGQFAGRSFASKSEMLSSRQESYTATPPILPSVHFTGKVVGVSDGDTISVMHNGKAERIRLSGIDCPEKSQAFGQRAKQFTSALVFGKDVTVNVQDTDRYGRTVGEVKLLDGRVLNQELVQAGLAWWYRKYAPGDTTLERLETEARAAKRGLWVEPHPVPPWEWRHKK